MTTARTIVEDALTEIGVLGIGSSASSEDAALGLRKLNQLLQRMSNSPLSFPTLTEISVPMSGATSYTIGPSGAVVAARPIAVQRVTYVDSSGNEYPVNSLNQAQWDGIFTKSVSGGVVSEVWYRPTLTNGTLYVYPQASSGAIKLDCLTLLTSFAGLSDAVTLPEGAESLLTLTLAVDLCRAFGRPVSSDLIAAAAGARAVFKRSNTKPMLLSIEGASDRGFEIERGY